MMIIPTKTQLTPLKTFQSPVMSLTVAFYTVHKTSYEDCVPLDDMILHCN